MLVGALASAQAQPTDNPVAAQYGAGNYPAWVDGIAWDNVIDVTADAALTNKAVAGNPDAAATNFAAFEEARDLLYAEGGGVLYFPAGVYHFSLLDAGYGPGIGPLSRGLMLKEGIVIRGDAPAALNAIVRNPEEKLDTDHDLVPTTIFEFPFQTRGTVPPNATGVNGEPAGTADAAGEVPTDWNFIGMMPGANETGVSDVDNVGIVNVALVGGTIVFGFDTEWATHMGADGAKWESANFKVDWPAGSAASSEDWINRVPDGQHYMDLINGRSGWTKFVESGSGRLVMNVKIQDGAPWNDMMYADRKSAANTAMPTDAFSHYRFAGRVIAYGSNVFIANNVIARPERNFVHLQKQNVGDRAILFDYANHLGIDINKSLLGGNQGHASVHVLDGDGYYASNIVVRDNWVFNRGNKGFEVSGRHMVIQNNHNERYVASNFFPYEYITNPEAYPSAVEGSDIDAGGISFDGYIWQSSESASDYLSRGYDLGGMDVWVDNCTVINTGSRGNDGEAILGQRHNNIETLSWAITHSKFGPYTIDDTSSSSSGANPGYIGPYDMHCVGLFLTGNEGPGAIGMLKPENNYMLDGTWFNNTGSQATPASGHSDDWLAPGKAEVPHTDPVSPPVLTAQASAVGEGIALSWTDTAANELGFRVERRIDGGDWQIIAYRPRASENGAAAYPEATISSAIGQFDVGDIVQTQWTDYLMPTSGQTEYRVVAINANDDDSTGVSNVAAAATPFTTLEAGFDDLNTGEINGQGAWSIDPADSAKATVESGALTYTAADGAVLDGGTQHLLLNGSAAAPMNKFLIHPVDPSLDETTYVRVLISSSEKGISSDPGELFLRLAGWNLYVAAKFYAGTVELPGGNVLEVDTANGLPLDVTHMVVLRLNVEAGVVTGVDLWLNPEFADSAAPDLSVAGLSVDLSAITQLEMRSQKTATRVDELLLAESWAEVVPEYVAPPFTSLAASFDDLSIGSIDGQGDWAINAADADKVTVESASLSYGGDATFVDGGTQHLLLNGSAAAPMNNWLVHPVNPGLDETTYVRALISSSDKGVSSDPGEFFLRLAGWNLYVAAKFYAGTVELPGGNVLEVDTANGLPLDVTHMVVLRLNVEAGVVTGVDLWLNPAYADEVAPDLSVSGLNVDLGTITQIEMRSQKAATRVDELLLAESWDDVVPQVAVIPFTTLEASFDDLNQGEIAGQGDWALDAADSAKATVEIQSLSYTAPDGAVLDGGTQHLLLNGSPSAPMNNWLIHPVDPSLDETTYVRALISSSDKGISSDPGELFLRLAGWNLYVAAKFYAGTIELPGGNVLEVDTTNGLPLDVTHMVVLRLNVEAGVVTGVDLWLNPGFADSLAPDLSVSGLSVDLGAITQLEMRSQKTATRVDELLLAESWAEVVPEKEVVPFMSLAVSFDELTAGEISGQGGWVIDAADSAKATVESGSLTYESADGAILEGGTQHLLLNGSAAAPMNTWLTLGIDPLLDGTTYVRALISSSDKGTSSDPGEFFLRLAGWNLYLAAKFYAGTIELPGGNVLEVDTANGLPLDVTHMVVLRLNVDAGVVTGVDLWLNPDFADETAPDLSVTGLSVDLSTITQIEMRSQKTPTRVDELLLAESWVEVVPESMAIPFRVFANQFENLSSGPVNGQDGWMAPEAVVVSENTFSFTTADGLVWNGGKGALALPGSTEAPINNWAVRGFDKGMPNETFYISYRASVSDNGTSDPSELFIRNAGWGLFSALKVTDDVFEVNGQQLASAGLAYDTPVHVVLQAVVTEGVITAVNGWLNPVMDADVNTNGNQAPTPDVAVDGLSVAFDALTGFEVRSQKAGSVVDDLVVSENWAECFMLRQVHIAAVETLGMNVQFEGQEDLAIGDLSPHEPEEEPPSIDSVPMITFQNALSDAFAKGLGGVADFEQTNVTVTSGPEWLAEDNSIATINEMVIALGERDIRVTLGENAYIEGNCAAGYTGKECANTDFLNPSPPENEDRYGLWTIGTNTNASSGNKTLGGHNSFDFDFNPADKLIMVSLTYINWDNFQSYQRTWKEKPNVRVRATFTNGTEDVVLLSTGYTEQTAAPWNTFFGFEQPESGYYLKRLELFTKGNNSRVWASIDDLAVVAETPDLFTFTFNNEGKVDGLDRPIQAANWDGAYSSNALPLVTSEAVFADLSEGVSSDPTPGHYKAGFLFVSGKADQPAPEGFLVWSANTNVVDQPQLPQSSGTSVNPQTDWYSDPVNSVSDLSELPLADLRELQMRIRPRVPAAEVRYHFAIQVAGDWYVSEEAFVYPLDASDWISVSLSVQEANWLSGVVAEGSLNLDFTATAPSVVTVADIGGEALLDTVGIYIDTDDNVGTDSWARVDSITLSAVTPRIDAPTITEQPVSIAVDEGDTATFMVSVLETEGITYQWKKDSLDIAGATASTLTLENVSVADAGDYTVVVSGPGGDAVSEAATLTVYPAPVVDPLSLDVGAAGGDQFITVTAVPEVSWTAESNDAWITVTLGSSGSGSDLVGISIAENAAYTGRTGTLLVAGTTVTVNQAGQPLPANFQEAVSATDNGDGTWTSPWLGSFFVQGDYIYHIPVGWMYTGLVQTSGSMYLYSYTLNTWLWTAEVVFPYIVDVNAGKWYYLLLSGESGWLYDYSDGQWIPLQ